MPSKGTSKQPAQRPRPQGDPDKFGNRGWKPPKPSPTSGQVKPPSGPGGTVKGK